ncbi:MAG: hypothetical protein QOD48_1607 [Gaiellaceae bacterium]|nr:hypothetical protein [Gaiellaceae bacterium]
MTRSLFARDVARTLKPAVQSCSTRRQNYHFDRVHTSRPTRGRIPAKGAHKVKTRCAETVGTSR